MCRFGELTSRGLGNECRNWLSSRPKAWAPDERKHQTIQKGVPENRDGLYR